MNRRHVTVLTGLGSLFVIVIGWLQWWKYSHFGYNGLDLGIYAQVVWSLAHGHGFASSIHDPSYLGDHLEAWLVPLSWLYRVWPSPLTLLWSQTVVIASTIFPLFCIARRYLNSRWAFAIVVAFLLHPFIYNIALYEFHGLVFALPLLFAAIWLYLQRGWGWWVLSLLAILIVREDTPFIIAGWALMSIIDRRGWKWWAPALMLAAIWFPTAQYIIRQANHDGLYKYLAFYGWLGTTPRDILTFPFRHPIVFLTNTITLNNLGTLIGISASVGFLCYLNPKRLWPLILVTAQLIIGSAMPGSFLRIHYTIPFIPFIVWAALEGLQKIRSSSTGFSIEQLSRRSVLLIMAMLGPLYLAFIIGPIEWPWINKRWVDRTPVNNLEQARDLIQPSDRVLTSFAFLPQLANRDHLYSLNYVYLGRRQYSEIPYQLPTDIDVAIIDWQELYDYQFVYTTTVFRGMSGPQRIKAVIEQQGLRLQAQFGTVSVYRRGGISADQATVATTVVDPVVQRDDIVTLQPGARVQFIPASVDRPAQLTLTSTWAAQRPKQDQPITFRLRTGAQTTIPQVVGQGLWPASEWPEGSAWTTTQQFTAPSGMHSGQAVQLEILDQRGRYRLNRLRTFRPIIDNEKVLRTYDLGQIE